MTNLEHVSSDELLAELARRKSIRCTCGKWAAYYGSYDADGYTLRCHGCLRDTRKCTCR